MRVLKAKYNITAIMLCLLLGVAICDSLKQGLTDSLGRVQETIIINESGLYSLIDDEDKLTRQIVVSGQNRNVTIINESGLYSLILSVPNWD